jgi:hypothetical protein
MRTIVALVLITTACGGGMEASRRTNERLAAQHRAAVNHDPPPSEKGEGTPEGQGAEFGDPSWDPQEPEYYARDPRVKVRGEDRDDEDRDDEDRDDEDESRE